MRKAKGLIRVRFMPRVAADIRAEVRRLVAGFRQVSRVAHHVSVLVVPHPSLTTVGGGFGFGVCSVKRGHPVRIGVAAGLARICQRHGDPRRRAIEAVGHTLLHELAHYEQFRDRRPFVERGVNVRASGLYRQINRLP